MFSILPKVPFLLVIILPPGQVGSESHFGKLEDRTNTGKVATRPKKGSETNFLGPRWGLEKRRGKKCTEGQMFMFRFM